jgi:hypothetical protein
MSVLRYHNKQEIDKAIQLLVKQVTPGGLNPPAYTFQAYFDGLMDLIKRTPHNRRVLLHVQRKGDIGSPRVNGSNNASRAASSVGSDSVERLRPAPLRRRRVLTGSSGWLSRYSSSRSPAAMVSRANPVAVATAVTPP